MNDEKKRYITLKEAAERLGYAYKYAATLWPSWNKFDVKAYRMGRRLLFKTDDIDRMVEMHAIN